MILHLKKQLGYLLPGLALLLMIALVAHEKRTFRLPSIDSADYLEIVDQTSFEEEIAFLDAISKQDNLIFPSSAIPVSSLETKLQHQQPEAKQEKNKKKPAINRQLAVLASFKTYVRQLSYKYKILSNYASTELQTHTNTGLDSLSELQCMALNLYFEARGESKVGQQAVAHVVLNRAHHRGFPKSVCDVVKQGGQDKRYRCQFTWWCDGRSDKPRNKRSWRQSVIMAAKVLSNKTKDPTNGALWYHADYVTPYWRRSMEKGPKIGKHIFYSSKKSDSRSRPS